MADNRVTVRLSDSLLRLMDEFRHDLTMTRTEFLKYSLQKQIAQIQKEYDLELAEKDEEIKVLRKVNKSLLIENSSLKDYIEQ